MKIRDVMTTDVRSAGLDTSLEEIASIMRDEDVGAVPIVDDDELRGIITDRDIVVRCIADGRDVNDTTVQDILTEDPRTISPNTDAQEAARIMADAQIRRLPVVEKGKLVGMVSIGDLAVKSDQDEDRIGRTLEEVSEGVKASGRDAERARSTGAGRSGSQAARRSAQAAGRQNSNSTRAQAGKNQGTRRQQPGSSTQMTERNAAQVRGRKPAAIVGGGRQQAIEQESGRRGRSTRGRIEAEQGKPRRDIKTGGRQQGIANRSAKEENARQSRVVNIEEKPRRSQRRKAS
jgi:CBS domain-containing protein